MKQTHMVVFALIGLAVGCARSQVPDPLVGTWTRDTPYEGEVPAYAEGFRFRADGTFQCLMQFEKDGALLPVGHQGTYVTSNGVLTLTVAMSDPNSPSTTHHAFEFPESYALRISVGETNKTFWRKD